MEQGQVTINSSGLVIAVANGTVTARATANDGSGVVGSLVITISGQGCIPLTYITVTGAARVIWLYPMITAHYRSTATVTPADATSKTVTSLVINGMGQATINSIGLVQ